MRLNQFISQQIKWTDFTTEDKLNLVELFVTHQSTLIAIYKALFPKTTNVERSYENFSISQTGPMD